MAYEQYGFNNNKTKYDLSSLADIQNRMNNMQNELLNRVYPIGCVYFSTTKTNPADSSVIGIGTWVEISSSQRFIVVTSASGSTSSLVTGGSNTKTITAKQIPDHAHRIETTTADNTEDPKNKWGNQRGKINPWGGVRVVPMGTGGTTGVTPYNLGYDFGVRRGYGESVEMIKPGTNVTVKAKDQSYTEFNNSFALETTAEKTKQSQLPQSVNIDITAKTKITGFTGQGIYTKDAWADSTINSDGTVTYTDLSQEAVDIRPAYITLYAWRRTA